MKKKTPKDNNENKVLYDDVTRAGFIKNFVTGKGSRRIATALIYDRVGDNEIFEGAYPLLKGSIEKIGKYCVLHYKNKPIFIDIPNSSDYTLCKDKKLNKIIEIVKFSDDDFRIRSKLNSTFYRKIKVVDMEEKVIEDETGEEITVKVSKLDKNNKPVYVEKEERYIEPKGIQQEGRDAIRAGNEYEQKMNEYKKSKEGFFEKYGAVAVPIVGLAIVAIVFIFMIQKTTDSLIYVSDDIKDTMKSNTPWYADDAGIKNLANKLSEQQQEKNNPPT